DPDEILQNSNWNDELKVWKLPEASMDAFKLPLASSLRSKQFIDSALQKRINSSNSLQSTLNTVSFIPVDYLKETIKTNSHVYSKNDLHHDKHCSAHSWPNEKNKDGHNNKVNNGKNMSDKTIYALQNYDHMDLDKSDILQNYFRSNRRKQFADLLICTVMDIKSAQIFVITTIPFFI
ncbi:hypothetical protein DOY81_008964, partial [Sarcophaga bullata]